MPNTATKRTTGRPAQNISRADAQARRKRVPVSGDRDILTVAGKDPSYVYRWVLDKDEQGRRVNKFYQGGYDFVTTDMGDHVVGVDMVYKSKDVGSIIRSPAGEGKFLYLMRIHKDFYEEDQQAKEVVIQEREGTVTSTDSEDGQYGKVKISRD